MTSDGSAWQVDNGPAPPLANVTFVERPPPPDNGWREFRSLWWRQIRRGERPEGAAQPPCVVYLLPFHDAVAVLFGAPVLLHEFVGKTSTDGTSALVDIRRSAVQRSPGAERASLELRLEWLLSVVQRWSTIEQVRVVNLTDEAVPMTAGLVAAGLSAVTVLPELLDVKVWRDDPETIEAGEPLQWGVTFRHPAAMHPLLDETFGDDVASLVTFVRRIRPPEIVPVLASAEDLQLIGPLLDEAGVAWRRSQSRDRRAIVGQPVTSGALTIQLVIDVWLRVRWSIPEQRVDLRMSGGLSDGLSDLTEAVRTAVIDRRNAFCNLDQGPSSHHVVLIPDPVSDAMRLEIWRLPDGDLAEPTPRSGKLVAGWSGTARTLAVAFVGAADGLLAAAGPYGVKDREHYAPPLARLDELRSYVT